MKHENSGFCEKCLSIINRYPGFNEALMRWFFSLQKKHPEAHISCAGRGEQDQEALFLKQATRAHWTHSAHNYNAALDLFDMTGTKDGIYSRVWFRDIMSPCLEPWIEWYGAPNAQFYELPHIQLRDWKDQVSSGYLKL